LARVKSIWCCVADSLRHGERPTASSHTHRRSEENGRDDTCRVASAVCPDSGCAGHVPLRDMGDFVRQHAGEFALVLGREQQSRVDADVAAGERRGIYAGSRTMKKSKR
jgi:hypothetical protein